MMGKFRCIVFTSRSNKCVWIDFNRDTHRPPNISKIPSLIRLSNIMDIKETSNKLYVYQMGLDARKPVFRGFANNSGANQPVHPRSLISAFVIRLLESTIFNLATGKTSMFYLVSVAEETGLKLA